MGGGPFTRTPVCRGAGGSGRHTGRGVSLSLSRDVVLSSVRPLSMAARRRGARTYIYIYIYIYMSRDSKGVRYVHHRSPRYGPPARINWANQCGKSVTRGPRYPGPAVCPTPAGPSPAQPSFTHGRSPPSTTGRPPAQHGAPCHGAPPRPPCVYMGGCARPSPKNKWR